MHYRSIRRNKSVLQRWLSTKTHLLFFCRKSDFLDSFSLHFKMKQMDVKYGVRSLTLQQGCCRGYSLRNSIHTVDGLEELWDTIILIRYQHLNLISASVMG